MKKTSVPPRLCEQCGREFSKPPRLSRNRFEGRRYCSAACSIEASRANRKAHDEEVLRLQEMLRRVLVEAVPHLGYVNTLKCKAWLNVTFKYLRRRRKSRPKTAYLLEHGKNILMGRL